MEKYIKRGTVVIPEDFSNQLNDWISDRKCRGLVITGPTGCGKTTLALQVASEILGNDNIVNYRSVDYNRVEINFKFTSAATLASESRPSTLLYPPKTMLPSVNIIDEAHAISNLEATRFLAPLELGGNKVIFCTNKIHSLPQELITRCKVLSLSALPDEVKKEFGFNKNNMRANNIITDITPVKQTAIDLFEAIVKHDQDTILAMDFIAPRETVKELFSHAIANGGKPMMSYFVRLLFDFSEALGGEQLKAWSYAMAGKDTQWQIL